MPDQMEQQYTPEGRAIVPNADGSFSSEISITVTDPRINDGKPTNIPSMFLGRRWSDEAAIDIIAKHGGVDPETGRMLPAFNSIEEAEEAAGARSDSLTPKQGQKSMRPDFGAALGRGGDTTMAHMTPGEAVIPAGYMTPKLWEAYQEALDRQGSTPEQYIVGSGENSVNPNTGQPEFLAQAAGPGRSVRDYQDRAGSSNPTGTDARESGNTGFIPSINPELGGSPNRASQQGMIELVPQDEWAIDPSTGMFGAGGTFDAGGALGAVGGSMFGGPIVGALGFEMGTGELDIPTFTEYDAYGPATYNERRTSMGRDSEREQGLSRTRTQTEQSYMRPETLPTPQFLGLSSQMTPLQQRSAIASRAVAGQGGEYTSPEAQAYYDNLIQRTLIGDGGELLGLDTLLPIDLQYLAQVRGIENPADTAALLSALAA